MRTVVEDLLVWIVSWKKKDEVGQPKPVGGSQKRSVEVLKVVLDLYEILMVGELYIYLFRALVDISCS